MSTKTVHVVSWVYWEDGRVGGGGFLWHPSLEEMEKVFETEDAGWGDSPHRTRLLDVEVPAELEGDQITAYLDSIIDDIESVLPARRDTGRV